ncbi:L-lactate dehydrogenase (cytochrome) [Talaromyces islandicus]|uniref:L-lactate dehydrogenase (cytochrome) n=1 Tax=Talaromyces islandicus TaxID=28573 RepID=A0A0U1LU36_TALIS|nr:L-lactate dehydrogenase (cytochrome) [Talaromyces islandicus]
MTEVSENTTVISAEELKKHSTSGDCWIAVHSRVYDVTNFLGEHPGGSAIILKYAGDDATQAYDEVHAPSIIHRTLDREQFKGTIDPLTIPKKQQVEPGPAQNKSPEKLPDLSTLLAVQDFEAVAQKKFSKKTFAFYSSAATDLISHRDNIESFRSLLLRPRVLRNVKEVSISRKILGYDSSAPFFVSPAAMAKLAHPDGELAIARACGEENIIQIISNNASYPLEDIVDAGRPGQTFFLQLYVNSERQKTEELLNKARNLGIKAIFVTVDAPIPGKREADERISAENFVSAMSGAVATNDKKGGGLGRVMAQYIDSSLNWDDLAWIKRVSRLPVFLKGVQTAADAKLAAEYGCAGVLLSNHGGRSLDTVQPAMVTLLEIHKECPEIFGKLEIYIDGGIRRGTDILKALALGATAVGVGRPYLYSLAYGEEGVQHLTEILKDELVSTMKLSGVTDIDQAHPGMVNTSKIEHLIRTGGERHPWIKWKPKARL